MFDIEMLEAFLGVVVGWVWGKYTVALLLGGGLFFTLYLRLIQIRGFKHAIDVVSGKYDSPDDPGEINHFKALCTALSGTVGLGNIAGVAVAIKIGGPGATVWMILAGLVGMATKYVECSLAVKYRNVDASGEVHGGPMYYIKKGLQEGSLGQKSPIIAGFFKFLSYMFAVCCIMAAFGAANMFQANQVAMSLEGSFQVDPLISGIVLAVLVGLVIIGGIKRIGNVAGTLVPLMGVSYVLACLVILVMNASAIPSCFAQIFTNAFTGTAATGGFAGAGFVLVMRFGVQRAAFSCEAGLGSAAIAHSAARTDEPVREGIVALLEPFIDTVVICTMTALVINITGVWQGESTGVALTQEALNSSISGLGTYFIPVAVSLFAFSSMISWYYYAERSLDFMLKKHGKFLPLVTLKVLFCLAAVAGSVWQVMPILNLSDIAAGLMIFPNMIALLCLYKLVKNDTEEYFRKLNAGEFEKH